MLRRAWCVALAVVAAVTVSCGDGTTGVSPAAPLALLTIAGSEQFRVFDLDRERVISAPPSGLSMFGEMASAAVGDSGLYVISGSAGEMIAFSTRTMRREWTAALGDSDQMAGLTLFGYSALSATADATRILVADAYFNGRIGVAFLDAGSRAPVQFVDTLRVFSAFPLEIGVSAAGSGGVVFGVRGQGTPQTDLAERRRGKLYFLTGSPLSISDSAAPLLAVDSAAGGVLHSALSSDGRFFYYLTARGVLYKYDLSTRQHVASIAVPAPGRFEVSKRDGSLLLLEGFGGSPGGPGPGAISFIDANLTTVVRRRLDEADYGAFPARLNAVDSDPESDQIVVGAGTGYIAGNYPPQRGRIIVMNSVSRDVVRIIRLDSWGVTSIRLR